MRSAVERRKHISQDMVNLSLNYEFVDAIDGKELSGEEKNFFNPKRNLKDSEIGCFLSHLRCYKKLLETDADFAVILEDDTKVTSELKSFLSSDFFVKDYSLLFLLADDFGANGFVYQLSSEMSIFGQFEIFKLTSAPYCTNAYLISRKTAQLFLDENLSFNSPIDHYANVRDKVDFYSLKTSICFVNEQSSVGSITSESWSPLKQKLRTLPVFYVVRDLLKLKYLKKFINKIKYEKLNNTSLFSYRSGVRVVR
jgi:glycosyl transferase family 25